MKEGVYPLIEIYPNGGGFTPEETQSRYVLHTHLGSELDRLIPTLTQLQGKWLTLPAPIPGSENLSGQIFLELSETLNEDRHEEGKATDQVCVLYKSKKN